MSVRSTKKVIAKPIPEEDEPVDIKKTTKQKVIKPIPDEINEEVNEPVIIKKTIKKSSPSKKSSGSKKSKPKAKPKVDPKELKKRIEAKRNEVVEALEFTELIYEDIDDDFAYGMFGPFKLVIDKSNGFFNAAKFCYDVTKLFGIRKNYYDWKRLDQTKTILKHITKTTTGIASDDDLIIDRSNLPNNVKGTYIHHVLVTAIALWASPEFYMVINNIVSNFYISKVNKEKDEIIEEQKRLLGEKEDKIDKLSKKLDETMEKLDEMQDTLKDTTFELEEIRESNEVILEENEKIIDDNKRIAEKLNEISHDRVVSTGKTKDEHILVIVKTNYEVEKRKTQRKRRVADYYVMRLMRKSLKTRFNIVNEYHPFSKIVKIIPCYPNSMNLWHRTLEYLTSGKIIYPMIDLINNNYFNVLDDYNIEGVIEEIKDVFNERICHA